MGTYCSINPSRFQGQYLGQDQDQGQGQVRFVLRLFIYRERAIQPLRRAIQPLRRAIQPLRRKQKKPLRRNDEPRQFTKPVVIHKQRNYSIKHLKRVYNSYITFNSVLWLHEYRSSVRKLTKQTNVKRYRDREPSRIPFKGIILAMRKRKNRRSIKHVLKRSAPKSSILNKIYSYQLQEMLF